MARGTHPTADSILYGDTPPRATGPITRLLYELQAEELAKGEVPFPLGSVIVQPLKDKRRGIVTGIFGPGSCGVNWERGGYNKEKPWRLYLCDRSSYSSDLVYRSEQIQEELKENHPHGLLCPGDIVENTWSAARGIVSAKQMSITHCSVAWEVGRRTLAWTRNLEILERAGEAKI